MYIIMFSFLVYSLLQLVWISTGIIRPICLPFVGRCCRMDYWTAAGIGYNYYWNCSSCSSSEGIVAMREVQVVVSTNGRMGTIGSTMLGSSGSEGDQFVQQRIAYKGSHKWRANRQYWSRRVDAVMRNSCGSREWSKAAGQAKRGTWQRQRFGNYCWVVFVDFFNVMQIYMTNQLHQNDHQLKRWTFLDR